MSEDTSDGGLARLRRERPRLYASGQVVLVLCLIVVPIVAVLPLPDLPSWVKWARLGAVIAVVALAIIGVAVLEHRGKRDPAAGREDQRDRGTPPSHHRS